MSPTNDIYNKFIYEGKIKIWPAKKSHQIELLEYLASKFEFNKFYTEIEVNRILNKYHTFDDPALLRRELFNNHLINRDLYGKKYWKEG
jgi:hypothetical protein